MGGFWRGADLMTGALCALAGASSSALDIQVVTIGTMLSCGKSGCTDVGYGYTLTGSGPGNPAGAISDGTFNPTGGTGITDLWWNFGGGVNQLWFFLDAAVSNSGWTKMTINGTDYARTSASFSSGTGYSQWIWSSVTSNPFGATSGQSVVIFT